MDIVNHEKEPINKIDVQIEIIANSRHNKPRRANTNITPQGIYFHSDYQPYHFIGLFYM